MFTRNESALDRLIRLIVAELLFILAWFWLGGVIQTIVYVLSLITLGTAITGFCGLYKVFGVCTYKESQKTSKLVVMVLIAIFLVIAVLGSYYSNFFTKKLFLEDFNIMNNFYKQTLFNTGQEKRSESIENYDKLVLEYDNFLKKYSNYHPRVFASDVNFNSDFSKVYDRILSLRDQVYTGNLYESHLSLEEVRPVFQDILKRNGFSMLAVYLVDFHDSMEQVITAADSKNATAVISAYADANAKLLAVEEVNNDNEIQIIRNNLEDVLELAKTGDLDGLSAKAAELKSSFVKVYLKRG